MYRLRTLEVKAFSLDLLSSFDLILVNVMDCGAR